MPYELTTLACAPLTEGAVAAAARDWIAQGPGRLLGAWRTEIGDLFQVKLLRQFDTADALEEERRRALMAQRRSESLIPPIRLGMERYARFPFLPEVEPATFGQLLRVQDLFPEAGRSRADPKQLARCHRACRRLHKTSSGQYVRVGWATTHHTYLGIFQLGRARCAARTPLRRRPLAAEGRSSANRESDINDLRPGTLLAAALKEWR